MPDNVNPHTIGDNPILEPAPTVQIGDRTITIRRLGIRDTFAIAKIVAIGAQANQVQLNNSQMLDSGQLSELMLTGFIAAEQTAMALLASLAGVTVKELENPDLFPMGSELAIIEALVEHQDLKAFLSQAGTLMRKLPETLTRSHAQSTN